MGTTTVFYRDARAHDLDARWPALDVGARRARLEDSLSLSTGPLEQPIVTLRAIAERAAAGLWRRDPSVWSSDAGGPAEDRQPARLADVAGADGRFDRAAARRLPTASGATDSRDVVLLGMGGSSLAPEVLRAVLGVAPGWPRSAHARLDRSGRRSRRRHAARHERCTSSRASPARPSSRTRWRRTSGDARACRRRRWADHFVAITDEGTELAARARTRAVPRGLHQSRPTSAAATRRCRSSASCRRR